MLVLAAGLAVGGILLYPRAGDVVAAVRDKLSTAVAVTPTDTTATAAVDGHPAGYAVDGLTNRYWGVPAPGASVDFTFAHPFRLLTVVIHSGASTNRKKFDGQARPSRVDLVITRSNGDAQTLHFELADRPGPQHIDTATSDVVRIRLVIRSAFGLVEGRHIALGEVEFFGRD